MSAKRNTIPERLAAVQKRIDTATRAADRAPEAIRLIAVSKTHPADAIAAAADAGQRDFGENYLQEALDKIAALPGRGIVWHFIGPIQSNKTRDIAAHFDWVHSVDRLKIARRLSDQRPQGLPPLNICLQVNVSGEASKSGIAPEAAAELAEQVAALPGLRLRGLMAIPAPTDSAAQQRKPLAALRALQEQLNTGGLALDTLSMGMSNDLEAAVAEGATLLRIGTAIFGSRST